MYKKVLLCFCVVLAAFFHLQAQTSKNQWVDSVFSTMSLDDKIGQLFMVPVYPSTDRDYKDEIKEAIKSHHVGGVIFMEGGPVQLANLTNYIQKTADIPVLIGTESERGLGKLIDSTMLFPKALMLGAVQNDALIYRLGSEVAKQMKRVGININFAPSADLISLSKYDSLERSFGQDKVNVANKAVAYMQGLQDNGVMACAKRFPLQGLTVISVKKDGIPELKAYIDTVELYPYKKLFTNKISSVLPASSDFPLFYEKKKVARKNKFTPALLTSIYAGDWLKKNMDYKGLVFVSIPDIRDKAGKYKNGEAEMLSFQAGNDMILFPDGITAAFRRIKKLLKKKKEFGTQLNTTVKRILAAKYDAGLNRITELNTDNLYEKLHTTEAAILRRRLVESAVTFVRDEHNLLPVKILENKKIATLSIGTKAPNNFTSFTSRYADVQHFSIDKSSSDLTENVLNHLTEFNTILVGIFSKPSDAILSGLRSLQENHEVIICVFDSPLRLKQLDNFTTVIEAYAPSDEMMEVAAQSIFGGLPVSGTLPLTISDTYRVGQGARTSSLKRFSYSPIPEDAGLDSKVLNKIESIAAEAVNIKATPGCSVLIAKGGKVIYQAAFGYYTYDSITPVSNETLYDLASVTKVSATLQTVMFMYDKGLIDINKKASYYLPELKNSNKKDFILKDILTHQAGLWPFLPFWAQTIKDSLFMPEYYDTTYTIKYPYQVAERLYASATMRDSLWNWIIKAKIRDKIVRTPYDYRYSDMGFYILQHLAEKILNQPIEDFVQQNLYEPLGAYTTGYLPLKRFSKSQIAPTENDRIFRKRLLVGTVHDQGAAMMGGVAGHAGLFSDANDLAKLGQMLLQDGYYGGIQYYKPETVHFFTGKQYETSRRGLGWDKPVQSEWNSPTSIYASPKTFGHTGFTGTCIWVDPEFNLVYVFLSNRVYPDMTNNKLLIANIRSRIQDVIYESIFSYCSHHSSETKSEEMTASIH